MTAADSGEYDDLRRQVVDEATQLRAWCSSVVAMEDGEHDRWDCIHEAFLQFVLACSGATWDAEVIDAVLFLIAWDSESEVLADVLAQQASCLIVLADAAVDCAEPHARWQLADRLGDQHDQISRVEPLLMRYARDADEYVRRRAILALARLGSGQVERIAEQAWNRGHEYERMAVLSALSELGSPRLQEYLVRAMSDGDCHLAARASAIQSSLAD